MLPRNHADGIQITFDDHRLMANAGLLLPATLARHLGQRELVGHHPELGGAPGRGPGATHGAGRQRVLCPRHRSRLPRNGCPLIHHHPPAQKPAQYHRGDPREGV